MGSTLTLASFCTLAMTSSAQTTWYVDASASPPGNGTPGSPYTSIQYAIDHPSTAGGDTLLVAPGTYVETVDFGGKALTLRSTAGPAATVIDANGLGSAVTINGGGPQLVEGFTLTGGSNSYGGGLRIQSAAPTVRDCVIRGNTAGARGGGVWIAYHSPVLERCVIEGNVVTSATGQGGGLYSMYGFSMSLVNCTIADNAAASAGGVKSEFSTGATMKNCIAWGNAGDDLVLYQSQLAVTYCDVEGGFAGTGNIDADPLFANAAAGDYHLSAGSPCIDAGDPASQLDPDGTRADMGALPFDACGVATYCTAGTTANGCTAAISAAGVPSASSGSGFVITVSGVEGQKQGIVFYGVDGRASLPWGAGTSYLCVATPIQRTPVQGSGGTDGACDGVLAFDWNAYVAANPGALGAPFRGGDTVDAQAWFRDPPSPKSTSLSNAIEFRVCP